MNAKLAKRLRREARKSGDAQRLLVMGHNTARRGDTDILIDRAENDPGSVRGVYRALKKGANARVVATPTGTLDPKDEVEGRN